MSIEGVRPPKVGDVIEGKYEILRRIGKGGMAVVYEARSLSLQRPVALKFLHAEMAENPKLVERFHREARNAAAITHPCVTYVFDVGWNDDRTLPYMAMELLEGKSLAAELRATGALSVQRVVHIGSRVLDALEAAHRLGVVHRDLKPENIFLAQQGTQENVKVLDFGISKVMGEGSTDTLTKTGTMLGTPAYMSPEQVKCARDVDARSDLYALGVVLYEMLAGKQAFVAESFTEIVYKILTEQPTPLLTLRPGLDASVVDLVQRAMHKDPGRRWPTAESMRGALQDVVVDTNPGEPKPTPLAWELPSPEDVSSAATVAARRAWELQKAVDPKARVTVAGKPSASSPAIPAAPKVPVGPASAVRAVRARAASGEARPVQEPASTLGTVTTPRKVVAPATSKASGAVPALFAGPGKSSGAVPALYAGPAAARPAARSSTRTMLLVGVPLVALVGVLAAGVALWAREGSPTGPATIAPPLTATPPMLPPLARPAAGVPLPGAVSGCRIRVTVGTPSATVLLDGETYVGNVDLPAACGTRHALRIEAPGHEPTALDLVASTDPSRSVELQPLPPPPRPAAARAVPPRPPADREPREAGSAGDPPVNLEPTPF